MIDLDLWLIQTYTCNAHSEQLIYDWLYNKKEKEKLSTNEHKTTTRNFHSMWWKLLIIYCCIVFVAVVVAYECVIFALNIYVAIFLFVSKPYQNYHHFGISTVALFFSLVIVLLILLLQYGITFVFYFWQRKCQSSLWQFYSLVGKLHFPGVIQKNACRKMKY